MKSIAILGSNGFIGRNLVKILQKKYLIIEFDISFVGPVCGGGGIGFA